MMVDRALGLAAPSASWDEYSQEQMEDYEILINDHATFRTGSQKREHVSIVDGTRVQHRPIACTTSDYGPSPASGQSKEAKYTQQDYLQREESEISDVRNVEHALAESCILQTSKTDQKGKGDELTIQRRSSSTHSKNTEIEMSRPTKSERRRVSLDSASTAPPQLHSSLLKESEVHHMRDNAQPQEECCNRKTPLIYPKKKETDYTRRRRSSSTHSQKTQSESGQSTKTHEESFSIKKPSKHPNEKDADCTRRTAVVFDTVAENSIRT